MALAHRRWTVAAAPAIAGLALLSMVDLILGHPRFGQQDYAILWRTDAHAGSLLGSAALMLLFGRRRAARPARRWFGAVPIAALLAGAVCFADPVPDVWRYTAGSLLLAIAVNTVEAAPRWAVRGLTLRPMLLLGAWSYSLYLWQQPFYKASVVAGPGLALPLLALAFGVGLCSFFAVEQPARRALNALYDRWAERRSDAPMRPRLL